MGRYNGYSISYNSRTASDIYLRHVQDVADRLDKAFPDRYKDAVKTMRDNNSTVMKKSYTARYR